VSGRTFSNKRKVRLGDVDPKGRVRLDALARYLQDIANDDSVDAGEEELQTWVVRKVSIAVEQWPRVSERVEVTTWCSGIGARFAERSTSIVGTAGGLVHATALWVYVDASSFLPARLPQRFFDVWAEAAGGRKVRGRLEHPDPPDAGVDWRPWPLRAVDLDVLDHVNNAATWQAVEDELWRRGVVPARAELEYRDVLEPGDDVVLRSDGDAGEVRLWLTVGDEVRASATVTVAAAG